MTREQVEHLVMKEREENEKMVKWYMEQIPGLCAHIITKMLVDICAANGLEFKAPQTPDGPTSAVPPIPPTAEDGQSGDAAAPEALDESGEPIARIHHDVEGDTDASAVAESPAPPDSRPEVA